MLIILKMEQIKETYKEVIEIPVYDDEEYQNLDFLSEYSDTHYKTKMKSFNYEDILAITTKETPLESRYHCSRGGALIFVKDRETPFLTADLYSVKKDKYFAADLLMRWEDGMAKYSLDFPENK